MRGTDVARRRWAVAVIAVLAVDIVLLAAHVFYRVRGDQDNEFGLSLQRSPSSAWQSGGEGSLIEYFGQAQLGAAAGVLLLTAAWSPRTAVLAVWGYSFVILAADDHFMLHEQVGRRLRVETLLPALAEPSAQELGGMLFWVAIAVPAATALAIAYRAGSPAARRGARQLSLLIAPLVALGAGHVLLSALHPSFFETPGGQLFSVGRTGVKLLTTSVLLLQATSISITAWQPARND